MARNVLLDALLTVTTKTALRVRLKRWEALPEAEPPTLVLVFAVLDAGGREVDVFEDRIASAAVSTYIANNESMIATRWLAHRGITGTIT